MPLSRISILKGKPEAWRAQLLAEIYEAMRDCFGVPEDDRFMVLTEHEPGALWFGRSYLGIERSDDFVLIQLTVNNTRDKATKQALYRRIVARLQDRLGLRPQDVMINLVEVLPENWSFGLGAAQYA